MYSLTSWGIFTVVVLGAVYYYAFNDGQRRRGAGWKPFTPAQARRRESSRQRRDGKDKRSKAVENPSRDQTPDPFEDSAATATRSSQSEGVKKRKGQKQQSSKLGQSSTPAAPSEPNDDDSKVDAEDLEFAKSLQDKITGTSLKRQDNQPNKKARKQGKRTEAAVAAQNAGSPPAAPQQQNSTASSTTGAEADDDMSSSTSFELGPTPSGADVSDMLEPAAKGPSILRITSPSNPQPAKSPKPQKAPQPEESKKQRQNRQKREAEKAVREDAERERQRLLENQRRTAREARGEPAKNGLGTSQQPAKNAWTGNSKAGGNIDTMAKAPPAQLLDTFEDRSDAAAGKPEAGNPNKAQSNGTDYNGLPSEEEQIKILSEMESDNGWNTVSKGGKKMKSKSSNAQLGQNEVAATGTADDSASVFPKGAPGTVVNAQANGIESLPARLPKAFKAKTPENGVDREVWNHQNIHQHPDYNSKHPAALLGHEQDSEWSVV